MRKEPVKRLVQHDTQKLSKQERQRLKEVLGEQKYHYVKQESDKRLRVLIDVISRSQEDQLAMYIVQSWVSLKNSDLFDLLDSLAFYQQKAKLQSDEQVKSLMHTLEPKR